MFRQLDVGDVSQEAVHVFKNLSLTLVVFKRKFHGAIKYTLWEIIITIIMIVFFSTE